MHCRGRRNCLHLMSQQDLALVMRVLKIVSPFELYCIGSGPCNYGLEVCTQPRNDASLNAIVLQRDFDAGCAMTKQLTRLM